MIQGIFGHTFGTELSACNPVGYSSKTSGRLLPRNSREVDGRTLLAPQFCSMSLESWKESVTKASGEYSARLKSAQLTGASECSSLQEGEEQENWHSPRCNDPEKRGRFSDDPRNGLPGQAEHWLTPDVPNGGRTLAPETVASNGTNLDGVKRQVGLENQAKMWATPRALDQDSTRTESGNPSKDGKILSQQAKEWATPKSTDAEHGGPNQRHGSGSSPLPAQAAQWGTPRVTTNGGHPSPQCTGKGSRLEDQAAQWRTPTVQSPNALRGTGQDPQKRMDQGHTVNLQDQVALWGTPTSRGHKDGSCKDANVPTASFLGREAVRFQNTHPHQKTLTDGLESSPSGQTSPRLQLNVLFVEWLMGIPQDWTKPCLESIDLEPVATEFSSHSRKSFCHAREKVNEMKFQPPINTMTVGELIEQLSQFPAFLPVGIKVSDIYQDSVGREISVSKSGFGAGFKAPFLEITVHNVSHVSK